MRTQLVFVFPGTKWREEREDMFPSCFESMPYLMWIKNKLLLYVVFNIWKRWELSRLGNGRQFGGVLGFWEKWQNKLILKRPTTGTNWTMNCEVLLGISNNRRQTTLKIVLRCLILTASGSRTSTTSSLLDRTCKRINLFVIPICTSHIFPPFLLAIIAVFKSISFIFGLTNLNSTFKS